MAGTPVDDASGKTPRLGRVEMVILEKLRRCEGLTQRDEVVLAAFPARAGMAAVANETSRLRRARAEAAVSRAILSLERKGLITRERNGVTGRTMLRSAADLPLPTWELMARAEEDLAAHCARVAREWDDLARRARRRAGTLRTARGEETTETERQIDLDSVARLEGSL